MPDETRKKQLQRIIDDPSATNEEKEQAQKVLKNLAPEQPQLQGSIDWTNINQIDEQLANILVPHPSYVSQELIAGLDSTARQLYHDFAIAYFGGFGMNYDYEPSLQRMTELYLNSKNESVKSRALAVLITIATLEMPEASKQKAQQFLQPHSSFDEMKVNLTAVPSWAGLLSKTGEQHRAAEQQ